MKTLRIHFRGFLLLLALALVHSAGAQESRPAATTNRHTLWQVEGRTNVVYLLGSVHLLKADDYPLAPPLESAYSNAAVVVFETDLEKLEQPEMQLKLMGKAQLPEGETLQQQLSPGSYASFIKHAEAAGLPALMFEQFKPAMAAMMLEMLGLQKLGFDPEQGIDKYFFEHARKDGKQIVGLETVDFQIGLATDFSKAEGELLMKTTLDEIDNTKKYFGEMMTAWRSGDATTLEKLMNEATQQSPSIFKRLVTDRNQRWVPQLEELLRGNKNAVVIVGAGHLVGSEGVVELLRKKGLKVTQL